MKTQDLGKNAAFQALSRLDRRMEIGQIADLLISVGYIADSPDDYRDYQILQARNAIRAHRRAVEKSGEITHELVNLFEVDDRGRKAHYFKPCGLLSPDEAKQHLDYWKQHKTKVARQYQRYRKFHLARLGDELRQLMLQESTA